MAEHLTSNEKVVGPIPTGSCSSNRHVLPLVNRFLVETQQVYISKVPIALFNVVGVQLQHELRGSVHERMRRHDKITHSETETETDCSAWRMDISTVTHSIS